ncbi:50S ribosomal protein L24 [Candidatus Microgenomates bacterium]|jgi:large subunit ribosomal protein L24|nr:MAG: 50S ribosomal protein L24 [Candidatus Microgenomates bacterium]
MKIRKGDKVKILLGKDRGKTGTVDHVDAKKGLVLVGGVNMFKKHAKPKSENDKSSGGIIDKVRPMPISKVQLICAKCGKITRAGFSLSKNGKERICLKCKAQI